MNPPPGDRKESKNLIKSRADPAHSDTTNIIN